jgi:predicted transcriptional regulator
MTLTTKERLILDLINISLEEYNNLLTMEHTLELESRIIEVVQDTIDNDELTKEEFETRIDDIVWDNMYQEIDTYLIYYEDQLEVMKELRLYDWSHLDNCTTIGQVAFRGLEEEIMSRKKVTNINNYKFNYEKQETK